MAGMSKCHRVYEDGAVIITSPGSGWPDLVFQDIRHVTSWANDIDKRVRGDTPMCPFIHREICADNLDLWINSNKLGSTWVGWNNEADAGFLGFLATRIANLDDDTTNRMVVYTYKMKDKSTDKFLYDQRVRALYHSPERTQMEFGLRYRDIAVDDICAEALMLSVSSDAPNHFEPTTTEVPITIIAFTTYTPKTYCMWLYNHAACRLEAHVVRMGSKHVNSDDIGLVPTYVTATPDAPRPYSISSSTYTDLLEQNNTAGWSNWLVSTYKYQMMLAGLNHIPADIIRAYIL